MIRCWPLFGRIKHARHFIKHHRPRRLGRHARRAAGIAVSKPAIVGYVCVAVGGIGSDVSIFSPSPEAPKIDTPALAGGFDIESFGPTAPQFPLLSETPNTPIPEPGSLALLALPAVGIAIAFGRVRP